MPGLYDDGDGELLYLSQFSRVSGYSLPALIRMLESRVLVTKGARIPRSEIERIRPNLEGRVMLFDAIARIYRDTSLLPKHEEDLIKFRERKETEIRHGLRRLEKQGMLPSYIRDMASKGKLPFYIIDEKYMLDFGMFIHFGEFPDPPLSK